MGEPRPSQGNILVVHDQLTTLEVLSAMLAGQGHQVQPVMTEELAVRTARESLPDLILLGTDLAKMDVYEVCAGLKADDRTNDIAVIFIDPEDIARVFATGGADYVRTPFQAEEVLARVQTHLAVKATRKQLEDKDSRLQHEIVERNRLEETLQEAEGQGRNLLENLSDVVYTADSDGLVTYVSPAIESFSGHRPSDITDRHFREFIYKEDQARFEGDFRRILDGHGAGSEYRVVTKSGEIRWMRTSSQPAFEGDRVTGVQGVLTDVTEQKQAEERIREQNEFLTQVLESLTHPFYVLDANDYTIQMANTAARVGRLSGEATCYALTHARSNPCSTADHPCPLEEVKRTKEPVIVEHIHHDLDGNLTVVEVHGYPLFDTEGKVVRVIEYTLDITERKRVEQEMRESEERWRSLTEYSPDHIMLLDRGANIRFINHALPELSREQVVGTSFYDYALEEFRASTQECFERVLKTGQPDRFESVYEDADGGSRVFESYVGPVMRSGEIWGLTVRSTDITDLKQAEEALQRLAHDLGERVKELNCLYGVSRLASRQDISLEEILQGTIDLMPPGWQHPEVTCARIVLGGQEFSTKNFQETDWKLATDLVVGGERTGTLEVCYLGERPAPHEGLFLQEERHLIDAVAERLGRTVERMQAQEALRQSEKQYRELLEALQEGIWVIDQDAYTTYVNPRMAEMLGYTVEEMLGDHLFAFMDERGVEIATRNLERREQGIKEQHDFEFLRKDGSRVFTTLETSPIYDDDGKYVGGIAGIQDVTERRRAEEALRESEARWRSFAYSSPDYVVILDTDLRIQFVNRASPGLAVEELIGTPLHSYVQEGRQSEIKGILENVLKTGEPARYETEYRTPEGSTIYYESRVVPRMLDGAVIGLAVNARNITERKEAEKALQAAMAAAEQARREEGERRREAERHLQVAESLADVLAALNSNQPLEMVLYSILEQAGRLLSNQAVAIYRQQGEAGKWAMEAAHRLPDDFADCGDMPPVQEALEQAVASRQPIPVPDIASVLDGGGDLALGSERLVPIRSWPGQCQALLAVPIIAKDEVYGGIVLYYPKPHSFTGDEVELAVVFSDQVALAIENARLREQVQQTAVIAERSRLARDLHDSVTQALFSATLVAEVLPQVWRRDPEEAQQGLQELRHLTRSALAEMRTMLLELRPTALLETKLDDLLQQLTEAITSRAQLRVTLDLEPIPALPPDAHVTFYRVAQEALHNAVKHAKASQVITSLRASPPVSPQAAGQWRGQVIMQVSDDGQGFDLRHVGPDQLGLGIMRERAESVGAVLTIEGQPARGTGVTLVWQDR